MYMNESHTPGCPAERVCVDVARACSRRQFKRISGHLEHEHDWETRARVLSGRMSGAEHHEL